MTLSPFLKDKYTYLFQKFYDANKNGFVTHSDFVETAAALKESRGWADGDPNLQRCEETLNRAWLALKHGADTDQDNQVSMQEWHEYWSGFVVKSKNGTTWPPDSQWIQDYMNFWFDLMDTSGDGVVDEHEFVQICSHFHIPIDDAKKSFAKFNTKPVNREYFNKLWLQYMTSDKKEDPGTYIFGKSQW